MPTVRLLGPIDVIDEHGVVHTSGSALRRTLLALLALRPGSAIEAERLLDMAWDGAPPASGLRALRFHMSRLRAEIGIDDLIVTVGSGYRLDADTDLDRVVRALDEPHAGTALLTALQSIWRGESIQDAQSCTALDHERRRLDELHLTLMERLCSARVDGGDCTIIGDLTRLCLDHPLRESLWSILIQAHYRAGNQADALRTLTQLRLSLRDELGVGPSPGIQELEFQILQHDLQTPEADTIAARGPRRPSGNLPRLQTVWVGDRMDLQRRVTDACEANLVTLAGPGGVGKTRAAIEIGWLAVDEFVDGVWMVELAPTADPSAVITTIAGTLGSRLQPGQTMEQSVVEWCFGRRMLLILDNCEHVLDPVTSLLRAIVASCPTVTVIATSREPLGVPGETLTRIESLSQHHATELFVLRARSADATFDPTATDHEAIEEICRRLDGIPLAIELAAARISSLSPDELLERLDDRFRLLRGAGRGGVERHRTLRATVAWSYQLLSPEARRVFDRLSVFADSFDLPAVEEICTGDELDVYDVIDVLGDLIDKSMVIASHTERGTRYRLLETLRQYGEERLDDRNETAMIRDAALHYFTALAERLQHDWESPDQATAGVRLDDDWANIGAAHDWAITTGDIEHAHRILRATRSFANARFRRDHQHWGKRTLQLADATGRHDLRTTASQGFWAIAEGDPDRAVEWARRALDVGDDDGCVARVVLLNAHVRAGHAETALEMAAELRAALADVVDPVDRFWAAAAIIGSDDLNNLESDVEVLLAAANEIGAPSYTANALRIASVRRRLTGRPDHDRWVAELEEAIRLHESVGTSPHWEWLILTWVLTRAGSPSAADALAETLRRTYDERQWAVLNEALEAAPVLLAEHAPDIAALIAGHVEHRAPAWGRAGAEMRALSSNAIGTICDGEALRARGATTDRHEIVALALAALDDLPSRSST